MSRVLPAITDMVGLLNHHAEHFAQENKIFFLNSKIEPEEQLSYLNLMLRAKAIAAMIQEKTSPGDRVLLIYPPGLEFICAFYACLYAGVVAVPVYPPAEKKLLEKLQAVIKNCDPSLVLSTQNTVDQIKKLKTVKAIQNTAFVDYLIQQFLQNSPDATQWTFDKFSWLSTEHLTIDLAANYKEVLINPDQLAFLQYTSGSTGQPKGVMVTHGNLVNNMQVIQSNSTVIADSVCIIWLPPYHDMGLIGGILFPIFYAVPVYLMSPLTFLRKPSIWLHAISRYKGTHTSAPNFAYALCNKKVSAEEKERIDLSTMRYFLNGAEPISMNVINEFTANFSSCGFKKEMFMPCYGLAEGTLMVTAQTKLSAKHYQKDLFRLNQLIPTLATDTNRCSIVGCGLVNETVKIVDPNTFNLCNEDSIGEIWVASASVAQGYWNQPQETQHTFQAQLNNAPDRYYLRTGDLGFVSEQELFVMGRIKDLIIINGTNHYPHDIETSVEQCHPALGADRCIAVSVSDDYQEKILILVEVKEHLAETELNQIIHTIREVSLQNHSLAIDTIALIASRKLPKTTSGKKRRNVAKIAFLENQLPIIFIWKKNGIEELAPMNNQNTAAAQSTTSFMEQHDFINELRDTIRVELADLLSIKPQDIDNNKNFAEFGLDSLMAVELESRLQTHLKNRCHLSEATVVNHPTINSLVEYIASLA